MTWIVRLKSMMQQKAKSDRFLFYAFLALFIWLPLPLGSNRLWAVSIAEIWVLLIAIAWLWLFMQNKVHLSQCFKQARLVVWLFFAFVLWVWVQVIPLPFFIVEFLSPHAAAIQSALIDPPQSFFTLSVNPTLTSVVALKSLSFFLIFVLTLLLLNNAQRIKYFAMTIVICGLFQAIYGSLMTLSGVEYGFFVAKEASMGAATGTFVNRNHLAGYLEMALAIGIGLMISTLSQHGSGSVREWFRRMILVLLGPKARLRIGLAIMVIALVLTRSRMGNTAFFSSLLIAGVVGLAGILWLARKHKISQRTARPVLVLFISLMIIDVFIVGAWFGIDKVKDRLEQTSFATEIRDEVDIDTLDQLKDYMLTGSGGGTFAEVFPHYATALFPGFIDHAHNDYLEFGSEFGIIGGIVLVVLVLLSLFQAVQAQFMRRSSFMRGIGFAASMGIIAILIHSTVDFNLQIPANAALFVSLLAFSWLAKYQRSARGGNM